MMLWTEIYCVEEIEERKKLDLRDWIGKEENWIEIFFFKYRVIFVSLNNEMCEASFG